jgi:hypothetical protein
MGMSTAPVGEAIDELPALVPDPGASPAPAVGAAPVAGGVVEPGAVAALVLAVSLR